MINDGEFADSFELAKMEVFSSFLLLYFFTLLFCPYFLLREMPALARALPIIRYDERLKRTSNIISIIKRYNMNRFPTRASRFNSGKSGKSGNIGELATRTICEIRGR
jgi:hypothetical protein